MNQGSVNNQSAENDGVAEPTKRAESLVLCSIDGMRPDALRAADTPAMDSIIARGAICWQARTIVPSVTLPAHLSMFHGVDASVHGLYDDNGIVPDRPRIPGLLDTAHEAGLRIGAFYNWEPMRDVSRPDSLDVGYYINHRRREPREEDDNQVTTVAIEHMQSMGLDVVYVYLGGLDDEGHLEGWMSPAYIAALENADRCVGRLVEAVAELGQADSTVVMVVTDHGGRGHAHGDESDECMVIPWMMAGPGIKRGYEITGPVRIFDTAPTAAWLLGLDLPVEWEGCPVTEALENGRGAD